MAIPTGSLNKQLLGMQLHGHEHDQAEDPQQTRGGAFNGLIRPFVLSAKAHPGSHFLESDLDVPAQDKPLHDLLSSDLFDWTEVSRWLKGVFRASHQYPTNRDGVEALSMP